MENSKNEDLKKEGLQKCVVPTVFSALWNALSDGGFSSDMEPIFGEHLFITLNACRPYSFHLAFSGEEGFGCHIKNRERGNFIDVVKNDEE